MSALFSSGGGGQPAPSPPPTPADPAIAQAAEAARVAAAQAGGRAATISTSGQGDVTRPTVLTQNLKTTLG